MFHVRPRVCPEQYCTYFNARALHLLFFYCNKLIPQQYTTQHAALLVRQCRDRFPVVSLGIFSVAPPTEPCALRSAQPLKVSTRDFSCGKGGRCVWLTIYHPCSVEKSRYSGALNYPEPLGPPRPVVGDLYFTQHNSVSLCNLHCYMFRHFVIIRELQTYLLLAKLHKFLDCSCLIS